MTSSLGQRSEVIVAVPVASPDRLAEVRRWCDDVVCLLAPEQFWAIGQFYADFTQVQDEEVIQLLREFAPTVPLRRPAVRPAEVPTGRARKGPQANG